MCDNMESRIYDDAFYRNQVAGSLATAETVVAFMATRFSHVKTVVDFGCGTGAWLSVFQRYGKEIQGFDFGAGAPDNLMIPKERFGRLDLSDPAVESGSYDLALCLEVAEHLPAEDAGNLVSRIASSAPLVLFSAAIPGQGGVHHVNEQYPSYWIAKFSARGFDCYDMVRPRFWNNRKVMFWYRQNMLIFKRRNANIPHLDEGSRVDPDSGKAVVDIVHPDLLAAKMRTMHLLMRELEKRR